MEPLRDRDKALNDELRLKLTATQDQRLRELGADPLVLDEVFTSTEERNARFKRLEEDLVRAGRRQLQDLRETHHAPQLIELEERLRATLMAEGFVQVLTPVIIAGEALNKMGIDVGHALRDQIFWVERGKCLRPMLAPNLYTLMRRLGRIWSRPFGIFEVGPCFRRDTKGSSHLNEFTMLNLVELGTELPDRTGRLEELAELVMQAAGMSEYRLIGKRSEVYGDTVDVEVDGTEVCSAAMGPHPLDDAWGIVEPWVGLGFGLERMIMAREGYLNIERVGRSLSYVDGVRLNI
jgi:pyrrolysyl-tRNA synthetase-like protein